jgi:1-pyrroline-4-hydroxy-2-carboxylate deaminase
MPLDWTGVFPAITTPFRDDGSVDHEFLAKHTEWMLGAGCHGLVPCGSLGEGATLNFDEKVAVLKTCVEASGDKPVIPGVAALSTQEAVKFARTAEEVGCRGLMVLPPYAYSTDWREMKAHMVAVMNATSLPCILYNNPVAYKTDFLPEQVAELANEILNLEAVKESSTDVRRVTSIAALTDKLALLVGVDDAIVEGIGAGATGWIAGLVNAFPEESVLLWRLALDGRTKEATEIYRWFLPMLRLDTVPKFVQLIKLSQEMVGMGSARVRAPRLELAGEELREAKQVIEEGIRNRPRVAAGV